MKVKGVKVPGMAVVAQAEHEIEVVDKRVDDVGVDDEAGLGEDDALAAIMAEFDGADDEALMKELQQPVAGDADAAVGAAATAAAKPEAEVKAGGAAGDDAAETPAALLTDAPSMADVPAIPAVAANSAVPDSAAETANPAVTATPKPAVPAAPLLGKKRQLAVTVASKPADAPPKPAVTGPATKALPAIVQVKDPGSNDATVDEGVAPAKPKPASRKPLHDVSAAPPAAAAAGPSKPALKVKAAAAKASSVTGVAAAGTAKATGKAKADTKANAKGDADNAEDAKEKAPRKPAARTALAFYKDSRHAKLKAEKPEADAAELNRLLAEEFGKLEPAALKVFQDKEAAATAKVEEWVAANAQGAAAGGAVKKAKTGNDKATKASKENVDAEGVVSKKRKKAKDADDDDSGAHGDKPEVTVAVPVKKKAKVAVLSKTKEAKVAEGDEDDADAAALPVKKGAKAVAVTQKQKNKAKEAEGDGDKEADEACGSGDEAQATAAEDEDGVAQDAALMDLPQTETEDVERPAAASCATTKAAKRGRKAGAKRQRPQRGGDGGEGAEATPKAAVAAAAEDSSDDDEADWVAHPADMILAQTVGQDSKYIVRRRGVDFTQFGRVTQAAAKRQRLEVGVSADEPPCPVDLGMVEDFEEFRRRFLSSFRERVSGNELDLDDLEAGSPLEMCSFLGTLMLPGNALSKEAVEKVVRKMKDIRVNPMMLSMVVQRIVNAERRTAQEARKAWDAERVALTTRVAVLEKAAATAAGGGKASMAAGLSASQKSG